MSCVACANDQTPAADPVAARLEKRLRALEELREMSLALSRSFAARILAENAAAGAAAEPTPEPTPEPDPQPELEREPEPAPAAPPRGRDPVAAFATLSKAVRLAVMLETRTEEELARLRAGVFGLRPGAAGSSAPKASDGPRRFPGRGRDAIDEAGERCETIRSLILETVDLEDLEGSDFFKLFNAIDERLDDDGTFGDGRDPRLTVELMLRAIRLTPGRNDWPWPSKDDAADAAHAHGSPVAPLDGAEGRRPRE